MLSYFNYPFSDSHLKFERILAQLPSESNLRITESESIIYSLICD